MEEKAKFVQSEIQQTIIDRSIALPKGILKKGLKKMDRDFSIWLEAFELICEKAVRIHSKDGQKESGENPLIDESFLPELISHISNFQGFDLKELIANMLKEAHQPFESGTVSDGGRIHNELKKDFWKIHQEDIRAVRIRKKLNLIKVRYRMVFAKLRTRKNPGYGTQSYQSELLVSYFLTVPGIKKTIELLQKRMQEYAKYFNYLHDMNEKEFRYEIGLAVQKFKKGESADLQDSFDLAAVSHCKIIEIPELSSPKDYSKELDQSLSLLETTLREKSKIAGTFLLEESSFSISDNEQKIQSLRKSFDRNSETFQSYFTGEGNDWKKDIEIITFQWRTINITNATLKQLNEKVRVGILDGMDKILELVTVSFEAIKEGARSQGFEDNILKENRSNLRNLRQKHIPAVLDSFHKAQLIKTIENFHSQIAFRRTALSDAFSILQKLDLESVPPIVTTKSINLKKIFETEYLLPLQADTDAFVVEAELYLAAVLRTLNEIGQMIQFNLETAIELIADTEKKGKEDAGKVLAEGLDRVFKTIQKVKKEVELIPDAWSIEISKLSFNFIKGIDELLDNENITNLSIRQAKAEASQRIKEFRSKANEKRSLYLRYAWKVISFGMTGARTSFEHLNIMPGASEISESQRELMNYLISTHNQIEKLPFIYQRLYRFEPLKDASIFAGGTKELDRLEECYELWRSGSFASVAIIGEKGSGRTSLVNIAGTTVFNQGIQHKIDIPKGVQTEEDVVVLFAGMFNKEKPATFNELETAINGLQSRLVIVVENLQNMFIRTVDGFDLMESFLLMISRTQDKPFWVISCGMYMWNYLDRIFNIKQYFYDIISMGQFDADELRDLILKRHRMSGYGLEFIPAESELADKKYKKLNDESDRQEFLQTNFFKDLDDICQGNISIALLLWQLSVENIKPDRVVIINDLGFQTSFLSSLSENELFTLEAIIEMEVLNIDEHSRIFNMSRKSSELILLRMKNKGLLKQFKEDFQIHFLLYKQVLRVLDSKNILK